jgi:hypothetical protein
MDRVILDTDVSSLMPGDCPEAKQAIVEAVHECHDIGRVAVIRLMFHRFQLCQFPRYRLLANAQCPRYYLLGHATLAHGP